MTQEGLHAQQPKQQPCSRAADGPRSTASGLSDTDLLTRVLALAGAEREATVELVAHLAELDARRLYLGQGYGSLFSYCIGALRLAEYAAYNRIEAARASREFPEILDLLADGSLNLSTVRLLAPHLRPDSFESVVAMAKGKSKRDVEVLVAHLAPHRDTASSIRRLPTPARVAGTAPSGVAPSNGPSLTTAPSTSLEQADRHIDVPSVLPTDLTPRTRPGVAPLGQPPDRPVVAPLAPARYRVQFTVGEATHEKLRRAQDLLRREIPDGDPGAIFDRALTLLLEEVARKKLAATSKPKVPVAARGWTRSRHIPARVKRAVWLRDEGQCAFVAPNGRRCTERAFLEFHHDEPYAIGGETTVANVSLRCHAHNIHEAELAFGPGVVSAARMARTSESAAVNVDSPRGELDTSFEAPHGPAPDGLAGWQGLSIFSGALVGQEASTEQEDVDREPPGHGESARAPQQTDHDSTAVS